MPKAKDAKFIVEEIDRAEGLSHLKRLKPIVTLRRILGERFEISENGQSRLKDKGVKVMYLAAQNISKKWTMALKDWKQAMSQFAIEFEGRMPCIASIASAA